MWAGSVRATGPDGRTMSRPLTQSTHAELSGGHVDDAALGTTDPVPPPRRSAHDGIGARLRRWGLAALAVAVLGIGWWSTSSALYLLGLALVAVATAVLLRRRARVAVLTALAVALVGIGGPWLAVQRAYRPAGVPVAADVVGHDYVPSDDELVRLVSTSITALSADGEVAWWTPFLTATPTAVWPLAGGRTLVKTADDTLALDDEGQVLWSHPRTADATVVAGSGDRLVERVCANVPSQRASCTWTGLDAADGTAAWTVAGTWAPGFSVRDGGEGLDQVRAVTTSLFLTDGGAGSTAVRDAGTGSVIQQVPAGPTIWLTGDTVLVLADEDGSCTLELFRTAGSAWRSPVDCALQDTFP